MMHEDVKRMDDELASCAQTLRMHPDLFHEYSIEMQTAIMAIERARWLLYSAENPTEVASVRARRET